MSISLDGFAAGPHQSRDNPLGVGGLELHHWHLDPSMKPTPRARRPAAARGSLRHGPQHVWPDRGAWDGDWRGWWGDDPPYHAPVFVLTHYPHAPIEMEGGTTFHFVTEGFDVALSSRRWPATSTSTSPVAPPPSARRSRRASSTTRPRHRSGSAGRGRAPLRWRARPGRAAGRGAALPACDARSLPHRPLTRLPHGRTRSDRSQIQATCSSPIAGRDACFPCASSSRRRR